jgi:calcium-dependent protein kinase
MGLKQMFKGMDTDNSGTITIEELKQGLAKQGTKLSETEVKQLMEAVSYLSFIFVYCMAK